MRYHLKPNGEAGKCVAQISCQYGMPLDEHYGTPEEAQLAYEKSMEDVTFTPISKSNSKKATWGGEYNFDKTLDNYDLYFNSPDIDGVFIQEGEDYAVYYRFEEMADLFSGYDSDDVRPGYSMNVHLNTLQYMVSPEIVDEYASEKNPFSKSKFKYDDLEDDHENDSFPIVAIIKDELFIVDGNHRFAAAKQRGLSAFAAVVVQFSDNMEEFYQITPEEFNKRFEKLPQAV